MIRTRLRTRIRNQRPLPALAAFAAALALSPACTVKIQGTSNIPKGDPASPQGESTADVATILAASDLPEPMATALGGDAMGVTIHRLRNGVTVYISTDREEPSFSAWIAVRTGSRNDPADSTGLAHYLEHMLFKGTERLGTLDYATEAPHIERIAALYDELREVHDEASRAALLAKIDAETQATAATAIPNEFDRVYASLGITGVNAFTSDEETVYISNVPRNRLQQWATIEADRIQHPIFRLFYPELEAVYEEKNMSLDSPEERVWEATRRLLFPAHPYGTQPTIGIVDHLKTPAYGDMAAYYRRWYAPNNIAIVLAGDIDAEQALPVIEQQFGGWAPVPLSAPTPAPLPPLHGRVFEELVAQGEQSVGISWQTVDANHADVPALEVLDMLVDNAASGLLNVDLVLTQKVPEAESFGENLREAGYWAMSATARDDQTLEEIERLLMGVTNRLRHGDFSDEDLAAIVLHSEINDKRRTESNSGRVSRMMQSYILRTPWADVIAHTDRLRAVTRDDVMRVAKTYLGGDRAVVYRRHGKHSPPAIPKPKITPVPLDPGRSSAFATDLLAVQVDPIEPIWLREGEHYVHHAMPAGPLIAATNRRNDLFSLSYRFEVGSRRRPLLCHALELLALSGAGDLDAAALQRKLYRLGTSVDSSCDDEHTTLWIHGIDRNLEASVKLLERWLREPRFTEATVKSLVANSISQRKDALEDPDFLGAALAAYASLGRMSPYLAKPSNKMLLRTGRKSFARELRDLPNLAHKTLYFGPRAAAEVAKVATLGSRHRSLVPRSPLRYREVKTPTLYFTQKNIAQAKVQIVTPQRPLAPEDRASAALYTQLLSGDMSGLIFQELREARGLAYRASAYFKRGVQVRDASALIGVIGTQGDKTIDALGLMLTLLQSTPVSEERFVASKTALREDTRTDYIPPRARPWSVYRWDAQGDAKDPREALLGAIQAIDLAALREFAGRFAEAPPVISVLGDRDRVDLEALRKFATIEEVPIEALVSFGAFPRTRATK